MYIFNIILVDFILITFSGKNYEVNNNIKYLQDKTMDNYS